MPSAPLYAPTRNKSVYKRVSDMVYSATPDTETKSARNVSKRSETRRVALTGDLCRVTSNGTAVLVGRPLETVHAKHPARGTAKTIRGGASIQDNRPASRRLITGQNICIFRHMGRGFSPDVSVTPTAVRPVESTRYTTKRKRGRHPPPAEGLNPERFWIATNTRCSALSHLTADRTTHRR